MFVGIQFTDNDGGGIALVHSKWLTPRKTEVWWPPFKQQEYFNRSIKKGESPNDTWRLYGVVKSFFEEGDYSKALQKIKKAEVTSDFPSGDEEPLPTKRKIIPSKRLFSSSDEEEGGTGVGHPLPPRVKALSPLLKRKKITANYNGSCSQPQEHNKELDSQRCSVSSQGLEQNSQNFSINILRSQRKPDEEVEYVAHNKENDVNKKILTLLVQIRKQNSDILHLLQQKKSATGLHLELPEDVPVQLPVDNFRDLRTLEDYLTEERISSMASYYATMGGRDITCKINTILKNLITNKLASEYSFLGSRNEKRSFQKLKLRKIVLSAVLSTCSSTTEHQIDDRIKVWLKHAPKRLSKQK